MKVKAAKVVVARVAVSAANSKSIVKDVAFRTVWTYLIVHTHINYEILSKPIPALCYGIDKL